MRKLGLALFLSLWALGPLGLAPAQAQSTNCIVPAPLAATPVVASSAQNTAGGMIIKPSPGCLLAAYVVNSTIAGFMMIFNSATIPADGAVTPIHCIPIGASSYQWINFAPQPPEFYSAGVSLAFSTTGCFTKTVSATLFMHAIVQ
jgi:hypothetical protein